MKQTPKLDRVQERMQPGEIALHGFLGTDERKLVDILKEDAETVSRLGVSHDRIADRLAELQEQGTDLAEREIEVEDRYKVHVRDDRGVLPSPWGDGRFCKGEVTMTDSRTGLSFRWNELTLHMIRAYGFYGGKGSLYRIDPVEAVRALDLSPAGDDQESSVPMPENP